MINYSLSRRLGLLHHANTGGKHTFILSTPPLVSIFFFFFSLHCRLSSSGGARPAAHCDLSSLHITEVYQYSGGIELAYPAFPWVRLAWAWYLIKWPLGDGLKVLACEEKKKTLTNSPGANTVFTTSTQPKALRCRHLIG